MTTTPDFRALCAELVDELNYHADEHSVGELIQRARTALDTSPPEPPTDEELVTFLYLIDPEDELSPLAMARAALERWGK